MFLCLLCQFLFFCLFIHGVIVVHNYSVVALCNTNKQLQHKKDHLLYLRGFSSWKVLPYSMFTEQCLQNSKPLCGWFRLQHFLCNLAIQEKKISRIITLIKHFIYPSPSSLTFLPPTHTHTQKIATKRHRGTRRVPLSVSHLSPVSVINWSHLAFPPGPLATVCTCQQLLPAFAQSFISATFFFPKERKLGFSVVYISNLKKCPLP